MPSGYPPAQGSDVVGALSAVAAPQVDDWPDDHPAMERAQALGHIERVDGEWRLTPSGEEIVGAAVAGAMSATAD